MSPWSVDNTNSNNNTNETTSTVKEEVPRMNTTTTPTPQRLKQALESFVEDLEGLEGAVQGFEEALPELTAVLPFGGLPGARSGQVFGLLETEERGDTLPEAGKRPEGKARRPRRVHEGEGPEASSLGKRVERLQGEVSRSPNGAR